MFRYLGCPAGLLSLIFAIVALSRRPNIYIDTPNDGRKDFDYGYSWGLNIIAVVFIAISNTALFMGQCMHTPQAQTVHGYPTSPSGSYPSAGSFSGPKPPGY